MSAFLQKNDIVLFQGDSITDCGRNRELGSDLGNGYAFMASGQFAYKYPELPLHTRLALTLVQPTTGCKTYI